MKRILRAIAQRAAAATTGLRGNAGFTLIELMIVIAIIGILSIIVVPRFMDIPQKARVEATKQQIAAFGLAHVFYSAAFITIRSGSISSSAHGERAV